MVAAMTRARSTIAKPLRVAATSALYMAASGSAVALTRFGGGAAFVWVANAVLLAALVNTPLRRWASLVACCWACGIVAAGLWGLGWHAAPFISLVNVAEPVVAALLVRRWNVHRTGLDSARNLTLFVVAAGIIAPVSTGLAGAAVIGAASHASFAHNYGHWIVGHALGALTFTPVFAQLASGEIGSWFGAATARQKGEAALLLVLVAVTAIGVFAQSQLPLLFLPLLPLMLITFRVGRIGAALGVVMIAVAGTAMTLGRLGPINLIQAGVGERLQFLQFYLAATVMTVLPVAADLARRGKLFERLRDSEARFRLLTENSTDIVLNLDANGVIRYASPSIALLGGYDPEQVVGRASIDLVDPEDRDRVRAVHVRALGHPAETFTVEYRGIVDGGEQRWFETHTRAVVDEDGVVRGVVSAVRDTSARRRNEAELSHAANTDPLTGLCNRRAFDRELAQKIDARSPGDGGCLAIFDLDHFKRVNDRFGHSVGDEVLCAFARAAESQTRSGDMLARLGGEEFGLFFPDIRPEQARLVCERIREAVAAMSVKAGDWPVKVTVSIGIAARVADDSPASIMHRADQALYASKGHGRNRSSVAA